MSGNRVLVEYSQDFGRMGGLDAVFVATREDYADIVEMGEVYLGEALGKHSEVTGRLNPGRTLFIQLEEEATQESKQVFDILEKYVFTGISGSIYSALKEWRSSEEEDE